MHYYCCADWLGYCDASRCRWLVVILPEPITPVSMFLLYLTIVYSCAVTCGAPLRYLPSRLLVASSVSAILACPLLIPADEVALRAVASLISADLTFKLVDVLRLRTTMDVHIGLSEFCRFLIPFPFLLVVFQQKQNRLPQGDWRWENISRTMAAFVICAALVALIYGKSLLFGAKSRFLFDHIVTVWLFVLLLETLSRCLYRLERLFGYETVPIVNQIYRSKTVAEFWRRYNTRVQSWFFFNLFQRVHRRSSPTLSVVLVFVANGLLHELMFGIATSRIDGYQLMFFLVQIPAVLSSRLLRRFARSEDRLVRYLATPSRLRGCSQRPCSFFTV